MEMKSAFCVRVNGIFYRTFNAGPRLFPLSSSLPKLLGRGGYGIIYHASDIRSPIPISYTTSQPSRRRQLHLHEIHPHKLASAHPNVISLHCVVEDKDF